MVATKSLLHKKFALLSRMSPLPPHCVCSYILFIYDVFTASRVTKFPALIWHCISCRPYLNIYIKFALKSIFILFADRRVSLSVFDIGLMTVFVLSFLCWKNTFLIICNAMPR